MSTKTTVLAMAILSVVCVFPAGAQENLGEMVAAGGYDWLIGKWVATTDDGGQLEFEQKWALDKHAILVDFRMGEFQMHGMIVFVPSREEIIQVAADNRGGTWKGIWSDEYGSAVHRMEHTQADGEIRKADIVHTKVDADTMKAAMYAVDGDGQRASEAWGTVTYKRQKDTSTGRTTGVSSSGGADQEKLGDLMAQYGHDWIIGKWMARNQMDSETHVAFTWALDKHVVLVDARIGQFRYHGMVSFVPSREEVVQVGADNMGGYWKGTWTDDYDGLVNRHEVLRGDGTAQKIEHVYTKVDADSYEVKEYTVDHNGYRTSTPRGELVFKRQKAKAPGK
jgi:hypothetical protein